MYYEERLRMTTQIAFTNSTAHFDLTAMVAVHMDRWTAEWMSRVWDLSITHLTNGHK